MPKTHPAPARPTRSMTLTFTPEFGDRRTDLSACVAVGDSLFLACDETVAVERLTRKRGGYGDHVEFDMHDFADMPIGDRDEPEMDIEGLDHDGGYLWIAGSGGLTRKKPKHHENDPEEALRRLTVVREEAGRRLLARVPLMPDPEGEGSWRLVKAIEPGEDAGEARRAACMKVKKGDTELTKELREDIHIGRFMDVPCKENGFDIEGIAARGDRVMLGLRGPVLRGWATIVEVDLRTTGSGWLKPRKIGPKGERYHKHFIDLDGLGIRTLGSDGDDLLILAGPTMDLDGPSRVYRWPDAWAAEQGDVIPFDRLEKVLELPYGDGTDHAEGITFLPSRRGKLAEMLVVYDSPDEDRLIGENAIKADVFRLG